MNLTLVLVIALGVLTVGAGVEGWMLKRAWEKNATSAQALDSCVKKLTEVNNVIKRTDEIHQTNNALPDDKLFDGLLPTAPTDQR